ncbi:MAG: hypothetical protein K2L85_07615 [Paramuribaculum sp.]|nr:hypothetical protein [Paramuribaculum sp.]
MSQMRSLIPLAALLIAAAVAHSCNTSGCTDNQSALPLAGYYSSSSGAEISVADMTVSGQGAPGDSALYGPSETRSEVYLPFRSDADRTVWLFTYAPDGSNPVTDRIEFTYTSEPYFASEECGAMYFYRITSMTHSTNLIDSVVITDSLITNVNNQRIKIYFRTADI